MALQMTTEDGMRFIQKTVTVRKPVEEVYGFWRDFERFPSFMDHIQSVTTRNGRSHWVSKAPAGQQAEWDAEISEERPNEYIAWRSLPGSDVEQSGEARFRPAPKDQGTEVSVTLRYRPPSGTFGVVVAKLFGEEASQQMDEDLYRFKQLMETGRIATTAGQPHGRREMRWPAGREGQHAGRVLERSR